MSLYWLYLDEDLEHPGGSSRGLYSKERKPQFKDQSWDTVTESES